jgi:hypothetical protein
MPWTLAGLTAGSWRLDDPLAPATLPDPGVPEAQAPMAWYDSAAVIVGEDAAWSGYGAGLATARGFVRAPGGRRPRAMFSIVSGTQGLDRNAIFITRGERKSWFRGGALGDQRGGVGDLGTAGAHLWTLATGMARGRYTLDAGFAQRGMGESQNAGVGESARGQCGYAGWSVRGDRDSLALRVSRGMDGRDLFPVGSLAVGVRRDAQENAVDAELWHLGSAGAVALRLAVRSARVIRVFGPETRLPRQEWTTRSAWLSARAVRPLAGGALDLQLGAGRDRSAGASSLVPGASWRVAQGSRSVRVFAERALVPVWSDLEQGGAPFTQDTWLGGFETAAGRADASSGSLVLVAGSTGSRATQLRYPIRGESQLLGWRQDLRAYRFMLLQGSAGARWGALGGDATGYALARPRAASQPRVDPGLGARAGLEGRFALFTGDLGVRLRVEGSYVGARETDARQVDLLDNPIPEVMLPAFVSLALGATLTIGDATIVLRGDRVGGVRRPESWTDPYQYPEYAYARDAGPAWRAEVTWPLFN